jgi:cbb3-type cytochrome oxidase maturation protein
MTALVILVPIALVLSLIGLSAFIWSVSHAQYEDLDGAAVRILLDDKQPDDAPQPDAAVRTNAGR